MVTSSQGIQAFAKHGDVVRYGRSILIAGGDMGRDQLLIAALVEIALESSGVRSLDHGIVEFNHRSIVRAPVFRHKIGRMG